MPLQLTDDELKQVLDTYNAAIFAEQCSANPANAAALTKLVAEARERGIDISDFADLGWLTGEDVRGPTAR